MSQSRVENHDLRDYTSDDLSPLRRSSVIVSSSSSKKRYQRHHQQRSSITTTSSSSSSSMFRRRPITSYHSFGTPPSPAYIDNSPLNDLRQRLATVEGRSLMFGRAVERRSSRIVSGQHRVLGSTSPKSAPATLEVPARTTPGSDCDNSDRESSKFSACVSHEKPCDEGKEVARERAVEEPREHETASLIELDQTLTSNSNHNNNNHDSMQVIEVRDDDDLGRAQANEFNVIIRGCDKSGSPEPIVEASSRPSSSSPSPKSPGQSPSSSRHSSDCENNSQRHQSSVVGQAHNQGAQDSSSSSSSSSRRVIRRRTVRRSYHHRALETENEPRLSNSLFVTTTTTSSNNPTGAQRQSESIEAQSSSSCNQSQKHEKSLSTSTSSSRIATSSHQQQQQHNQKKSTQTQQQQSSTRSSSSSSTSSRKIVSQEAKKSSEQKMISTSNQTKTIDLNDKSEQQHQQPRSLFERRSRLAGASSLIERAETGSVEIEQEEESSVRRRELSSFNTSSRLHRHHHQHHQTSSQATSGTLASRASSTLASESSSMSSLSRSATKMMSSSSSRDAREQLETSTTTKWVLLPSEAAASASAAAAAAAVSGRKSHLLRAPDDDLFSSPDARSFAQELGTDFAELENALSSTSFLVKQQQQQATRSSATAFGRLSSSSSLTAPRLFGDETRGALALDPPSIVSSGGFLKNEPEHSSLSSPFNQTNNLSSIDFNVAEHQPETGLSYNSGKIRQLMDKAHRQGGSSPTASDASGLTAASVSEAATTTSTLRDDVSRTDQQTSSEDTGVNCRLQEKARCKAVMSEKIEKFDQKMSDWCKKLEECNDTQKAIDLMKIMIQMIEKAWSVPVCGDDLGFKLCNSMRQFGGLDIILGFIHEADERSLINGAGPDYESARVMSATPSSSLDQADGSKDSGQTSSPNSQQQSQRRHSKQLRLNLSKVHQQQQQQQQQQEQQQTDVPNNLQQNETIGSKSAPVVSSLSCPSADNDSDVLTSDLGLDSTSVESLSYVSAAEPALQATVVVAALPPSDESTSSTEKAQDSKAETTTEDPDVGPVKTETKEELVEDVEEEESEELKQVRRDELVFLSAHLLSQCLTSENRDYIVKFGLDPVIKLACNFTTMKSGHSKRLLKRSALMRQSSTMKQKQKQEQQSQQQQQQQTKPTSDGLAIESAQENQTETGVNNTNNNCQKPSIKGKVNDDNQEQRSDMHSAIGTEILQHLFKHSEETCWRMISLGALQAILYGCRSSHIETLRHCASALANLALYGGPDSQQMMIEQKAHVWLFPLAFNEDDNVQYYACLAIVVLAANQEIEADVLQSSTLDLVDPFVTSHEPRKFAESTTSHIHGQSASWLKKLMPLLESKREEARNLACFHFAMEAYIKREQGQTNLFKEIGSIELLRKAGSSPIAITSKFACQALRLIGEREPHKLSQQVPLWTCDDVCEWVNQIGFEKFQPAFRDSFVDGDLLLQLDEQQLRFDIGIENGLIRRRFLRELSNLKRIADYSSVDKGGLSSMLVNSTSILNNSLKNTHSGNQLVANMIMNHLSPTTTYSSASRNDARDFLQYIYPILKIGVTKDNIHLMDCEQLLADCKISNTLHRLKLAHAIHELQDRILLDAASSKRDSLCGEDQKTLDVFVSYRRSTGSQLASLLKVHLQLRGFSVFIDVERLEAGKFDNNLLDSIKTAKNFILVLSPSALDRCIGDHERKDWVHKEIVAAIESKCNIIPIIDNFHWPDPEQLPEDMRSITTFNGIRWIHDYQDACVEKVERFIRGELSNSAAGGQTSGGGAGSIISSVSGGSQTASVQGGGFQRLGSACNQSVTNSVSTPSIVATTPSLCSNQAPYGLQNKTHPPQAADHHPYTPADASHHPLASAYTDNLYLQQNLRLGNSNNNVRLQ